MPESQVQGSEQNEKIKAVGLFKFLKEVIQLRSAVVRDANEFVDVLWLNDFPHEQGCYCAGWPEYQKADDNAWIEIKKQSLPKIPSPPENCSVWIQKESLYKPDGEPQLLETVLNPAWKPEGNTETDLLQTNSETINEQIPQFLSLQDFPQIQETWISYVSKGWKPWAEEYKRKKAVQDVYARLFSMYQQQKSLGETYEVVLGLGYLTWKTPKEQRIARHIVTAQISLDFNSNQGSICVRPSTDGARLQFEQDMLEADERPLLNVYLELEERLKEISNEIWHNKLMHAVLRSWVQALHSEGDYTDSWEERREFGKAPKISFCPALILRKRSTRGYIRFIEEIIKQIHTENRPIPPSVKLFTEIESGKEQPIRKSVYDEPTDTATDYENFNLENNEIYFPLPANAEQKEIIYRLGNNLGVLVQGPPGTGKSHTIANLICHLLADGKRVLVTSQTPRALKVLMGKLPAKIRPLCVNILGRGLADVQSMESSVGEINSRHNTWNANQSKAKIKKLESDLYETKKRIQEIEFQMKMLREEEVKKISILDGMYVGTPQQIAVDIAKDEGIFGWIQDEIKQNIEQPCSVSDLQRFLQLKRMITIEDIEEFTRTRINSGEIASTDKFIDLVRRRQVAEAKVKEMNERIDILHLVSSLKKFDKEKRENAIGLLNKFRMIKQEVLKRPLNWLPDALTQILGEQDQPLKELELCTKSLLEGLKDKGRLADETNVKWPNDLDIITLKADAEDLCSYLIKGGKIGWPIFASKVVKRTRYITKQIFVNGRPCDTVEALEKLIVCLGVEIVLQKLGEAWETKIDLPSGTFFHRVAIFSENHEALCKLMDLENVAISTNEVLQQFEGIVPPVLYNDKEIETFITAIESIRAVDELKEIESEFDRIFKVITAITTTNNHHTLLDRFLEGLSNQNWQVWGDAYAQLKEIEKKEEEYQVLVRLENKLKDSIPNTVNEMLETIHDSHWNERISNFDKAWKWSQAESWLDEYSLQHDEYALQNDYKHQQKKQVQLKEELAAEKAWTHCFSRMTEKQRQHLMAWSVAIKKLGKGTGKYAEKHRRDAEANLNECQGAIPAWIMPLYRVVDTITPQEGIFDVVIIDEASQCGSEALILQYIAKQCIIVGDEEQIAPEAVGIELNQVHLLMERFLKDIPIKESFDVQSSLFTHGKIRYRNKIVLKEHFRCVPEIIQFSNNLCYAPHGASLIPLRQYPPNRLDPIKTVHVPSGFREGFGQDVINRSEADEMVKIIVSCHKDKKYQAKTFGVISLQGHAQSKYIEKRLVEELGPEAMEERSIVCGEAYDFQGDERNIMFVSMVAGTNERIGALAKETDKRRFNVAASRAADQVWLFHSVTLQDLTPIDLRYQLLNYYLNPQVQQIELDGIELEPLKKSKRDVKAPEPFDSWFEVDLYIKLVERGYRVIPQFRVAGYKIDLVVEGMKGRLAVECDGDEWHGPDVYEQDMARQRILERAKWSFWRVRGSSYYRDPDQALEPLWQKLEELGIYSGSNHEKEKQYKESEPNDVSENLEELAEKTETDEVEVLDIASASDLEKFRQRIDNSKRLTAGIARATVIKILQIDPSKGKDLLPNEAIRWLEYTCRRDDRKRLEKKIQRAITDLIRIGKIEEYATSKRKRLRLISSN